MSPRMRQDQMRQDQLRIDFSDAPHDPLERLVWLSGAKAAFDAQVNAEWQRAYFEARLTGRFQDALDLGLHSRKRALTLTRAENERRGRSLRWGDGFSVRPEPDPNPPAATADRTDRSPSPTPAGPDAPDPGRS